MDKLLPLIDVVLCDGCGLCVARCSNRALGLVGGKAAVTDPERCQYDAACEDACPTGAIALPYQVVFAAPQMTVD